MLSHFLNFDLFHNDRNIVNMTSWEMFLKANKISKIQELPGAGPPPGIRHGATGALNAASYSLTQIHVVMLPLL
jgi:hypothetical protein